MPVVRIVPKLGMFPAVASEQLPPGAAELAVNCRMDGQKMQPWKDLGPAFLTVTPGTKTIYQYDEDHFFQWNEDADVAKGSIFGDQSERIYFTREGYGAFFTTHDMALAGQGPYPAQARKLGLLAPEFTPALSFIFSGDIASTGTQLSSWILNNLTSALCSTGKLYWGLSWSNETLIEGTDQLSTAVFGGISLLNTQIGKLYFAIIDTAGTRKVSVYKSTTIGDLVAEGTLVGDGVVVLAEKNSSGITGFITIAYTANDALAATNVIYVGRGVSVFTQDNGSGLIASGVSFVNGSVVLGQKNASGVTGSVNLVFTNIDENFSVNVLNLVGPGNEESRSYVMTYLDGFGAEGPPSLPQETSIPVGAEVVVSYPAESPDGYPDILSARIYRTNSGSAETAYQYVADCILANGSFKDTLADDLLGELLPSLEWDAPPGDLMGITSHPAGYLVGFSRQLKAVCFSQPYLPQAWRVQDRIYVDEVPVGLGTFGMSIVVLTEGPPYLITGQEPGSLSKEKYEAGLACSNKRSIVDLGEAILYASQDGLVLMAPGRAELITKGLFTADEWSGYQPDSIEAYAWDGNYLAFYGGEQGRGFVFTRQGQFSQLDFAAIAGARGVYGANDLFLLCGTEVKKWQGGQDNLEATFKSGIVAMNIPTNLGCAQVLAESYPVTFKLYADGNLKLTHTVRSRDAFRLPAGFMTERYQAEAVSRFSVTTLVLAGTMAEMRQL